MIRVRLTTSFPSWPLLRQTPGGRGVWGDHRFFVNEDVDACDYWVVYDMPAHSTCVEPQTATPDAFNVPASISGVVRLELGEELRRSMTVTWSPA